MNPIELPPGSTVEVNLARAGLHRVPRDFHRNFVWPAPRLGKPRAELELNSPRGRRGSSRNSMGRRVGKMLVIAEISLSLILLAAAGLLIEEHRPHEFRAPRLPHGPSALRAHQPPGHCLPKLSNRAAFYNRLISDLAAKPGVDGVALTSSLPLYVAGSGVMSVQGRAALHSPISAMFAVKM